MLRKLMPGNVFLATALLACSSLALGAAEPATVPATASATPLKPPPGATRVELWKRTPNVVAGADTDVDPTIPTLDFYPASGGQTESPAALVIPGGGYVYIATGHEGEAVARFLSAHHISAFVLRYRHAPRYHNPIPLEDAQRAMRLIRTNAGQYHIDPKHLGVIGFSAGGHLAASLATAPDEPASTPADEIDKASPRPDFAALIYPVIDFMDDNVVHKGSREALMGKENVDNMELREQLSPEKHVTRSTPPCFLVHADTDKTVPVMNSVLFFEACHKAGVSAELHIFSKGPHGFGLAPKNPQLNQWPELMLHWLAAEKQIPLADVDSPSSPGPKNAADR